MHQSRWNPDHLDDLRGIVRALLTVCVLAILVAVVRTATRYYVLGGGLEVALELLLIVPFAVGAVLTWLVSRDLRDA